jgi:hypothetical protein
MGRTHGNRRIEFEAGCSDPALRRNGFGTGNRNKTGRGHAFGPGTRVKVAKSGTCETVTEQSVAESRGSDGNRWGKGMVAVTTRGKKSSYARVLPKCRKPGLGSALDCVVNFSVVLRVGSERVPKTAGGNPVRAIRSRGQTALDVLNGLRRLLLGAKRAAMLVCYRNAESQAWDPPLTVWLTFR